MSQPQRWNWSLQQEYNMDLMQGMQAVQQNSIGIAQNAQQIGQLHTKVDGIHDKLDQLLQGNGNVSAAVQPASLQQYQCGFTLKWADKVNAAASYFNGAQGIGRANNIPQVSNRILVNQNAVKQKHKNYRKQREQQQRQQQQQRQRQQQQRQIPKPKPLTYKQLRLWAGDIKLNKFVRRHQKYNFMTVDDQNAEQRKLKNTLHRILAMENIDKFYLMNVAAMEVWSLPAMFRGLKSNGYTTSYNDLLIKLQGQRDYLRGKKEKYHYTVCVDWSLKRKSIESEIQAPSENNKEKINIMVWWYFDDDYNDPNNNKNKNKNKNQPQNRGNVSNRSNNSNRENVSSQNQNQSQNRSGSNGGNRAPVSSSLNSVPLRPSNQRRRRV